MAAASTRQLKGGLPVGAVQIFPTLKQIGSLTVKPEKKHRARANAFIALRWNIYDKL